MDIALAFKADLADDMAGLLPVAWSVGPRGEAVALLASEADRAVALGYDERAVSARFPHSRAARGYAAVALLHDGDRGLRFPLRDVDVAHPFLQPLPGGEWLVAGARCRRFPDGSTERNGRVYGPDGAPRRELCFGDGIADVQVGTANEIWVSYRDEGVFGNYGWGDDAAGAPVGAAGLVRFDIDGDTRWEYMAPGGFGMIVDCYALNVADRETWAYYYTDFPLVRVGPGSAARGWQTDVAGAYALAVDGRRVLLVGGYPPHRDRCILAGLGETALTRPCECRLVLPSGAAPVIDLVVGRGPILHQFAGTSWWQVDIRRLR